MAAATLSDVARGSVTFASMAYYASGVPCPHRGRSADPGPRPRRRPAARREEAGDAADTCQRLRRWSANHYQPSVDAADHALTAPARLPQPRTRPAAALPSDRPSAAERMLD